MVSTFSITMQSLGKIVLREPVVGAKMWCLSVFFLSVTLRSAGALFVRGDIIWTSMASRFMDLL